MAIEIPKAVQDQIDLLKATVEKLIGRVDQGTARSVRQEADAQLDAIRKKSLFQGLGEQPPHKHGEGQYPFALYKKSTKMDPVLTDKGVPVLDEKGAPKMTPALDRRGDPLVDVIYAQSDADKAEKIANGWFVNPLGIAEKK